MDGASSSAKRANGFVMAALDVTVGWMDGSERSEEGASGEICFFLFPPHFV